MDGNKPHVVMVSENNSSTIIEDDQQLYDWGIENQLDQYYHGNNGAGNGPQNNSSVLHGVPENELPHPSYPEQGSGPGYLPAHPNDFQHRYPNMPSHPSYQDTHSIPNCHAPPYSPGQETVSSGHMDGDSDNKVGVFPQGKLGRAMMPRVDMDANEVLKVRFNPNTYRLSLADICFSTLAFRWNGNEPGIDLQPQSVEWENWNGLRSWTTKPDNCGKKMKS